MVANMRSKLRRISLFAIAASVFVVVACGGDSDGVTTIVIQSEPVAKVAPAPEVSAAPELPALPVMIRGDKNRGLFPQSTIF